MSEAIQMGFKPKQPKFFPGDVPGEISMSIQDGDDQIKADQEKINEQVVGSWGKSFWSSEPLSDFATAKRGSVPTEEFLGCLPVTTKQTSVDSGNAPNGAQKGNVYED
jgi:hypothetical protein